MYYTPLNVTRARTYSSRARDAYDILRSENQRRRKKIEKKSGSWKK